MTKFTVSSAGWSWMGNAETPMKAAVKAIQELQPDSMGALVQIESDGEETCYVSSERAIEEAGFEVRE